VCECGREGEGKKGKGEGGEEMQMGKKKICNLAKKPQDYVQTISIGKIS